MRFIAVLSSLLTFILHVFAGGKCLTKADADELVTNFISLTNGNAFDVALARALIAPDVVDTSGSVASIINSGHLGPVPLLGPTIVGLQDFIKQNSAQSSTPYQPLNLYYTCDTVIFRFEIPFTPQPVLGISILETAPAPAGNQYPFQIKQVYAELNSWAFLVDLGVVKPPPVSPPS